MSTSVLIKLSGLWFSLYSDEISMWPLAIYTTLKHPFLCMEGFTDFLQAFLSVWDQFSISCVIELLSKSLCNTAYLPVSPLTSQVTFCLEVGPFFQLSQMASHPRPPCDKPSNRDRSVQNKKKDPGYRLCSLLLTFCTEWQLPFSFSVGWSQGLRHSWHWSSQGILHSWPGSSQGLLHSWSGSTLGLLHSGLGQAKVFYIWLWIWLWISILHSISSSILEYIRNLKLILIRNFKDFSTFEVCVGMFIVC